ncbi:MAG TPA: pyridoxal phosphate-dependent aminotransferase [Streptosporangiaceae bacterium]|jgi:alanine-synthesizing transaminase|nr:pyridoxal phosphate-dependent aminotransferase [Streptosporangiaceae bacterium]
MEFRQASRLNGVCYEIRGPVIEQANALEAAGHSVLRLNIGNPAAFGFQAPEAVLRDMARYLPAAHGYSDARGILPARQAVADYYTRRLPGPVGVDDVYLGNGVSELAAMAIQALVDPGDEVLLPSPDYPLWTAVTRLAGGTPVHYTCDETAGWLPALDDIEARITDRARAIVVINPNNPTGAVYPPDVLSGIADLARRHNLMILADEIYDKILYDGAVHQHIAAAAPDVLCLTFGGLSKSHRVAGFRAGWLVVSGPRQHARDYLEGLTMLAGMRLCPSVPAQHAIPAALADDSLDKLLLPGGRLAEQRNRAWQALNEIPGVTCVRPQGAIYAFPRIDPAVHPIHDDEKLVLDLLLQEKIHIVQGTGFNWPRPDHLRIVTLPPPDELEAAIRRIGRFLDSYRQ